MNDRNKYLKPVAVTILIFVITVVIGLFVIKPLYQQYQSSTAAELGLDSSSYERVKLRCPSNIELASVCIQSYYTQNSTQETLNAVISSLRSKGYELKQLQGGYDGPDQQAIVAYSASRNVSVVIVIIETYKKANGNIRVESYTGRTQFDIHK